MCLDVFKWRDAHPACVPRAYCIDEHRTAPLPASSATVERVKIRRARKAGGNESKASRLGISLDEHAQGHRVNK